MAAYTSSLPHSQKAKFRSKAQKEINAKKGKEKENPSLISASKPQPLSEITKQALWAEHETTPWEWTSLTDPSSSKVPPLFTKDGNYFFALIGSSVKIHSVATGQVVSTLSAPVTGNKNLPDVLTSIVINPHNSFQLITGCLDGRLMVWDFIDATLLQTIHIEQSIHFICAHEEFRDCVFVATSKLQKNNRGDDNNAVVLRVSLKQSAETGPTSSSTKTANFTPIGKIRFPSGLAFSRNGAWLVATAAHKVYVARSASLSTGFTKYVSPERLTCLAFHPYEEYFATGDEKGIIRLWYCLNNSLAVNARGVEKRTQTTALHWHAHAISSLAFSPNGAYLLSGGEEAVLVVWQLHTGKKEFVPRVGAPISAISVLRSEGSQEEYLLGLADSTFSFINPANLRISRSFSRIKTDPTTRQWQSAPKAASAPIAMHPLTSTLILRSSHPSSLQTYSPSTATLISELEVSPSNRVSRRDEKPIEPSRVEIIAVSRSGRWMASIDARDGDLDLRGEVHLKIWSWDRKTSAWSLNTRIERPHGPTSTTDMKFSSHEKSETLATSGRDGSVKLWRLRTRRGKADLTEDFWVLHTSFRFRNDIPSSVSWSPDASLLAASIGPSVALYDPISGTTLRNLTRPGSHSVIQVHFVGKGGRYLLDAGVKDLTLWDLVTHTARWTHNGINGIEFVVPHPKDDTFAVFSSSQMNGQTGMQVSIFYVNSPKPIRSHTIPFQLRNVIWYSSPPTPSIFSLLGISESWSVVSLGDEPRVNADHISRGLVDEADSRSGRRSLFTDIFGKSAFADVSNNDVVSRAVPTRLVDVEPRNVFENPAYLTPPLEQFFEPLVNPYLRVRQEESSPLAGNVSNGRGGEGEEDEDEMEDENLEADIQPQSPRTVSREELESLVSLFRRHSVKAPEPPVQAQVNGTVYGVTPKVKQKINGHAPPSALKDHTPIHTPSSPSVSSPLSMQVPLPISNGKKRKKLAEE